MKVVSFDSSLRSTGVCVYTPDKCYISTWKYSQKYSRVEILAELYWKMVNLFISLGGQLDFVLIEDYAFSKYGSSKSVSPLAEVQGILKGVSAGHEAEIIVFPSTTWKSLNKWKSMKKETSMQRLLYCQKAEELFNIKFRTTDEADAYMMMNAFDIILNNKNKLTKFSKGIREVILSKFGPVSSLGGFELNSMAVNHE